MAKENPAIKSKTPPAWTKNYFLIYGLAFLAVCLGLYLGYQDIHHLDVQDGTPTTLSDNDAASTDNVVTPSIKIETASATLLRTEEYSGIIDHVCTVEMSGTIQGPPCSFLSFSAGRLLDGRPGLEIYPFKCPSWRYWGTSPICSRDPGAPISTTWSITHEVDFSSYEGYQKEIIAILDTAKQPVLDPFGELDYRCTNADLDQQITDSAFLTC